MTTPLAADKVNEIRDIFDHQQRNTAAKDKHPATTTAFEMNPEERLREKEAILSRLAMAKERLDSRIIANNNNGHRDQPHPAAARPAAAFMDHNQTVEVSPVDATWMQSSDESFLRWEQDCDKTMQPSSQQTHAKATADPEMAAINRLMREYNLDNQREEQQSPMEDADQTQLEDVEPPSGIWDTTVMAAKMQSPVKMMHALRPSTIIEEDSLASVSMASSYKTAASALSKVAPSERYETATETICLSSDQSTEDQQSNVIEIFDDSLESKANQKLSRESSTLSNSGINNSVVSVPVGNATLDGISSLMPDSSVASGSSSLDSRRESDYALPESRGDSLLEDTPDFNDTLERIEFMEQQGKKLLEQQKTAAVTTTPSGKGTTAGKPHTPKTPGLGKTLLPSSSTKRVFYPSPSALKDGNNSPGAFKKPGAVRSPQIKFVPPKRNFDHIVSPIATYIKDVPTQTFFNKYKGQTLFSNNSPIKKSGSNTPTKDETKENKQTQMKAPQWQIPRKVFTSTNNRHEIDNRQQTKIPGGFKVHQMVQPALGQPNKIIRHEGRVQMDLPKGQQPRDSIFDETLANMSLVSGDVSIQVIQDMKKH